MNLANLVYDEIMSADLDTRAVVITEADLAALAAEFDGRWHFDWHRDRHGQIPDPRWLEAQLEPQRQLRIGGDGIDSLRQHLKDHEAGRRKL